LVGLVGIEGFWIFYKNLISAEIGVINLLKKVYKAVKYSLNMANLKKRRKAVIALAQMRYSLDTKKNVERIKEYIHKAARQGADIVCFPEACLHQSKQFELRDSSINEIREECKKREIWAIIADEFKIKDKFYNAALLIDRKGNIKGIYKKINTHDEDVDAGRKLGVFKTDFGKIGIGICWDLKFPALFKKLKERGAEIVFLPARWCYEFKVYNSKRKMREKKLFKSLVGARAYENFFFMAAVNPVIAGKYFRDLVSYSAIFSPHRFIKEIFKKEGLLVAELNLNEIKKVERIYLTK
jgi:predicted amidohydrolase